MVFISKEVLRQISELPEMTTILPFWWLNHKMLKEYTPTEMVLYWDIVLHNELKDLYRNEMMPDDEILITLNSSKVDICILRGTNGYY